MSCQWKNFCQWPQNTDYFGYFETDSYRFDFSAINFCLLIAWYPLKYWKFFCQYKIGSIITSARQSLHPSSKYSSLGLLPNPFSGKKMKIKRLLHLKQAELWKAFWGNLQFIPWNVRTVRPLVLQWTYWKTWRSDLFPLEIISHTQAETQSSLMTLLMQGFALSCWGPREAPRALLQRVHLLMLLLFGLSQSWSFPSITSCLSDLPFPRALVAYTRCLGDTLSFVV